jgi:hypothetical protein
MSAPKGASSYRAVPSGDDPRLDHGEPIGPTGVAVQLRVRIAELEESRAALPRSQRKAITLRLKMVRDMLKWCETRAGYRAN